MEESSSLDGLEAGMQSLQNNPAPPLTRGWQSSRVLQEPRDNQCEAPGLKNVQKIAAWLIVLIVLLLCSAYSNTFSSPPVLDDFHSFVFEENVHIKDLSVSSLEALSRTVFGIQRWIPMISFSLDLWFGNGEIFTFHLTNLVIHLTCMLAVLFLVFNLVQAETENGHPFSISPLLLCRLGCRLVGAQSRADQCRDLPGPAHGFPSGIVLYCQCCTSMFWDAGSIDNTRALPKRFLGYLACLLTAVGAFLSKENSAMLPVMLLVTEVWFFTPDLPRSVWKRLRAAPWVVWGVLFLGGLIFFLYSARLFQDLTAGYAIRHFTMLERLLTEARVVVWYLSLLLWPAPSRLSLEHDVVVSSSLLNPPTTLAAVVLLALLGWLILRYRKESPLITYGGDVVFSESSHRIHHCPVGTGF